MKTKRRVIIFSFLFILHLTVPVEARVFKKSIKIGYVDIVHVFDKNYRTDEATELLKKKLEEKKEEIEKRKESINLLTGKLKIQGGVLEEEEKFKLEEEVELKIKNLENIAEKFNRELQKQETELIKDILDDIKGVIKAYGKDNDYDFILESRNVLYSHEDMDITKEIIKFMNEKGKRGR